jgi:hypothetical protein
MVEAGLLKSDGWSFRAENPKENALIYKPWQAWAQYAAPQRQMRQVRVVSRFRTVAAL